MSNTYKHKDYFKGMRLHDLAVCKCHHRGNFHCICKRPEPRWWKEHRFSFHKTPRDSKTAKYIIQTLGHRRRRASERVVCKNLCNLENNYKFGFYYDYDPDLWWTDVYDFEELDEVYDVGLKLEKQWSNVRDYY